jgi:hypothetical protein
VGYFSSGTEGAAYEERYCSRCAHSDWREGKDLGDKDNPPCPVWMAHLLFAYEECNSESNAKQMLDMLIPQADDGITNLECAMFLARDAGAAIEGQLRIE